MEQFFRNKSLLQTITKWKTHLAIILIVSIGIGIFISSPIVITPLFKSEAILYPVNIFSYSDESETEQMLQILRSNDLKLEMLDIFNLAEHYKLTPNTPSFYAYFLDKYDNRVSIAKTEFEAVHIQIMDHVPQVASDMVDTLIVLYNRKVTELLRRKQLEMIHISLDDMNKKQSEIDSLSNLLKKWNLQFGIIDLRAQAANIVKNIPLTEKRDIEKSGFSLNEIVIDYKTADSLLINSRKDFIKLKNTYEKSMSEYKKDITYSQIISNPFPTDKKAYPVRWLIVVVTVLASMLLAIISISVIESTSVKK